jgi:hypothetical protein
LRVFKLRGLEGGIGVPKHGGPLNSTSAGLLNHQISKISKNSIWMKNLFVAVSNSRVGRWNWDFQAWGTP